MEPFPASFAQAVLAAVRRIPRGRVATYGDVADAVGRPGAARAVARVLAQADERGIPYHRVVSAGGRITGPGASERARRLRAEGVRMDSGACIADFGRCRWGPTNRGI